MQVINCSICVYCKHYNKGSCGYLNAKDGVNNNYNSRLEYCSDIELKEGVDL